MLHSTAKLLSLKGGIYCVHTDGHTKRVTYLATSYREIGEDTIFFIFVTRVNLEALKYTTVTQ